MTRNSKAMVAYLDSQITDRYGGIAAFNVARYNASFYGVSADQPRSTVSWDDCQGKRYVPPGLFGRGGQFVGVPIPWKAVPSAGTDRSLIVYQASTDTLWEFWRIALRTDGWHACWGGRLDHVSKAPGYFSNGFGASASGLSVLGGAIGIREARAGRISHALTLAIPSPAVWTDVSWPAQRSDGSDTDPRAIPEGNRLRLDPALNVTRYAKQHKLHPLAVMVARAAQRYGFIVTDKAGAVSVGAESGAAVQARTKVNPWTGLLAGTPDYLVMRGFPWKHLQVLPANYGRPRAAAKKVSKATSSS